MGIRSELGRAEKLIFSQSAQPVEVYQANREQAGIICADPFPVWQEGDSRQIKGICPDVEADFVFSCPPYADLEVYSDDPRDLSTLDYPEFLKAYREIIADTISLLKPNRFACFVVGDLRNGAGFYRRFPWDTVRALMEQMALVVARHVNDADTLRAIEQEWSAIRVDGNRGTGG